MGISHCNYSTGNWSNDNLVRSAFVCVPSMFGQHAVGAGEPIYEDIAGGNELKLRAIIKCK